MLTLGEKIIQKLPYSSPFLFVDKIKQVDDLKIIGNYTFDENDFFYRAHFSHKPVTPGIIVMEMMGQIGMVSHIIFLENLHESSRLFHPVLSNISCTFLKEVMPGNELTIEGEKKYFRKGILKSTISLMNSQKELLAMLEAQVQLIYD